MPDTGRPAAPAPRKPGTAREATLYRALAGAGSTGTLDELRAQALAAHDRLGLPTWRRSGFWRTTLDDVDLAALANRTYAPEAALPAALGDGPRAGALVQRGGSVVHAELDPALAAAGVILCSLEDAARDHAELFTRYFMRRLTLDRDKLEAASAALWTGGAFLYVPPGLAVEHPFQIVYEISEAGTAQYAHTLAVGEPAASSASTSTTSAPTSTARPSTPASSSSTSRTPPAAAWPT